MLVCLLHIYECLCFILQEFECGVSVAGSDKQEWSFTLYDFDGRGKVTKEVGIQAVMDSGQSLKQT